MKRWLAALAPWMVIAAAYGQDAPPVAVEFTYQGAFSNDSVRVGDDVFAAPVLLRKWGWEVETRYQDAEVKVEDRVFRVGLQQLRGRPMVNLTEAARFMGARTSWSADGKTYRIRSWIRNIELTGDGIRIDATLPFRPRIFRLSNPTRLVIDLEGAEYDSSIVTVLPSGWRAGQVTESTARIVIEHDSMATQPIPPLQPGRTFALGLRSVNPNIQPIVPNDGFQGQPLPVLARLAPAQLTTESSNEAVFSVPIRRGRPGSPVAEFASPTTLRITFPNSEPENPGQLAAVGSALVESYSMAPGRGSSSVLTLNLRRPLVFDIAPAGDAIQVRVMAPANANGTLAGKVIVVDPGHGGHDPGAVSNGAREKDVVLRVGNLMAQFLAEAGASVIRTRSDDRFVELRERSEIANRNRAAAFISIHCNSNTVDNTASGTITFFHKQDPADMLLAACIQAEIARLKRMPDDGAWSDTRIYKSGFSVLRNAQMAGVLVELGFINHRHDRSVLTDPNFQQAVARAMVRGLKVYFGGEATP